MLYEISMSGGGRRYEGWRPKTWRDLQSPSPPRRSLISYSGIEDWEEEADRRRKENRRAQQFFNENRRRAFAFDKFVLRGYSPLQVANQGMALLPIAPNGRWVSNYDENGAPVRFHEIGTLKDTADMTVYQHHQIFG
jgi:hypothetical protein